MSGNCMWCNCLSVEFEAYRDSGGEMVGLLCKRCEDQYNEEGHTTARIERHPCPFEKNGGYLNYSTANVALWLGNTEECTNDIGEATRWMHRNEWKRFAIECMVKDARHVAVMLPENGSPVVLHLTPDGVPYDHPDVDWITLYYDMEEAWRLPEPPEDPDDDPDDDREGYYESQDVNPMTNWDGPMRDLL